MIFINFVIGFLLLFVKEFQFEYSVKVFPVLFMTETLLGWMRINITKCFGVIVN